MTDPIFADANDDGIRFILPENLESAEAGGLYRAEDSGHFVTLVGRGGTGKSILALQFLTRLLRQAPQIYSSDHWGPDRPHAAFYFTLEAHPAELRQQLTSFDWGKEYDTTALDTDDAQWVNQGLHVISIPAPVADLTTLTQYIRQSIARVLPNVGRVLAIVIDAMGGIQLTGNMREQLFALKQLSDSHRVFLFLLVEDHIFLQHRAIEYFSQSILHLEHDPNRLPHRRLYVQKSRGQHIRSGYHSVEVGQGFGIRVFPSVQAQSAYAHDKLKGSAPPSPPDPDATGSTASRSNELVNREKEPLFKYESRNFLSRIKPGSAIFLMGPPGTFKQTVASGFLAFQGNSPAPALYVSFKADKEAVRVHLGGIDIVDYVGGSIEKGRVEFIDARSPISAPEELLSKIRSAIAGHQQGGRAVIWGLRRLRDMPNFAGPKAVEFLEAFVTLLKAHRFTSLLVDWPDVARSSTLPIVDLCQYILLTRVCRPVWYGEEGDTQDLRGRLWNPREPESGMETNVVTSTLEHVTLLRVQRIEHEFHRNLGLVFQQHLSKPPVITERDDVLFAKYWDRVGRRWERDPGLWH